MERKTTTQALSRQRRWQLKQIANRRCSICGRPASRENREFCAEHRARRSSRRRTALDP